MHQRASPQSNANFRHAPVEWVPGLGQTSCHYQRQVGAADQTGRAQLVSSFSGLRSYLQLSVVARSPSVLRRLLHPVLYARTARTQLAIVPSTRNSGALARSNQLEGGSTLACSLHSSHLRLYINGDLVVLRNPHHDHLILSTCRTLDSRTLVEVSLSPSANRPATRSLPRLHTPVLTTELFNASPFDPTPPAEQPSS